MKDEDEWRDEQFFAMTYARSRPNELVPWIEEHDVPLLTNAVHRWSSNTERLLDMWYYDTPHVIDAGGYNVMASYVAQNGRLLDSHSLDVPTELCKDTPFYPWTVEEYHEWLCEHSEEFLWATSMDYACEERFDSLWDYRDRREATLDATIRQYELLESDGHPYTMLPVLQGRTPDEYVDFYESLEDHGLPTDAVGLGTVCRMSSEKRIVDFEQTIRDRIDVDYLHGFGVKIEAFKHGATFDSADSQAWVYGPTNGRCVFDDGDSLREVQMPDHSLERTVTSFKEYYSYVTRLQQGESAVDYECSVSMDDSDDEIRSTLIA